MNASHREMVSPHCGVSMCNTYYFSDEAYCWHLLARSYFTTTMAGWRKKPRSLQNPPGMVLSAIAWLQHLQSL